MIHDGVVSEVVRLKSRRAGSCLEPYVAWLDADGVPLQTVPFTVVR